jgi:multiple sugar transport system substrate-binding protein
LKGVVLKIKYIYLLVFTLLISGCTPDLTEKKSIMLLHYFTGSFSQGFDELSEKINKKSKNINLVSTPMEHEEFKVSIRVQLETENPPDLFSYWAGARTTYLIENDKVSPISSIFKNIVDPDIFDQSVINACSYNGEMYLLPLTRHFVGFFYNRMLFEQYSLKPPETWEEMISAAEILKGNGITPFSLGSKNRWPAQFWFDYILLRTAGYDYRQDLMNKTAAYTDLEVLKSMDIWKTLLDSQYYNRDFSELTWDEAAKSLVEGEAAMTLMGTWIIPYLEDSGLNSQSGYGFFPFPQMDTDIATSVLGPIDGILVSKDSKNKEQALEILPYLTRPEIQEAFNSKSGAIAPHKMVDESIYSSLQLEIKKLIEISPYWAFNYDLATEPAISESGLELFRDFLNSPEDYEMLLENLQKKISLK